MAARADDLIDRRRLRRKLSFWRVAAILLVAAIVIATTSYFWRDGAGIGVDHIARIKVEGTITDDEELLERLERVRESAMVKGVVLHINSPGGTTAGGEAVFEAVRKLAAEKPVVAQVGTLAASAGYMIASAADHIVARQSSIVGSIGVLFQYPDITGLMENMGIKVDGVKSSPLKAEPSPFTPTTEEERAMIRALVMDSYEWFVGLVQDRRPLDRAQVLALADGSIFTGRQALESRLVDSLGGEEEAVRWLGTRGVDAELDVVEWKPRNQGGWWGFGSQATIASILGLDRLLDQLVARAGLEPLFLDGLVSVWQPRSTSTAD
jgi:protease IV